MMYQVITKSDFCNNKRLRENFSYDGLAALYDHLEELDENLELDPIALCCEYAEGEVGEVLNSYNLTSVEELEDKTLVVWHEPMQSIVLYAQF